MSRRENDEISFYPEIKKYIKEQIESNFRASKNPLSVYCETGELRSGLQRIINENNIHTPSIVNFASNTPPLSLDIFALITDNVEYELLIIEVKLKSSVGLSELSQLIGYCIVSNAQYGLLINVNGGESSRLSNLIMNEPNVTHIVRVLDPDSKVIEHNLGAMHWDSETKNLTYSGYGAIKSISKLCERIAAKFETHQS